MANLLQRFTRSAPAPAPAQPAPVAEAQAPGEDGATGHADPAPAAAPAPPPEPPTAQTTAIAATEPSWRVRGRLRRRLRYLRAAREVALRDLGGLVFDLHRFGRERPDLVTAKLDTLGALDRERRELEGALGDQRETDVLRVPGLTSCPRCGSLMASDARFCSSCGAENAETAATP